MFDLHCLEALVTVVNEGSFTRAAKKLFITQSAISHRIRQLEEMVGQPLIIRSPEIKATTAGQAFISHYRNILLLENSLSNKFPKTKSGFEPIYLPIAINTETLSTWFIDSIRDRLIEERILLELLIDDQEKTVEYLQNGKAWGVVTSKEKAPFGCISKFLGNMIYRCVATPQFKSKYFEKKINGEKLLRAPAAAYGKNDYMHLNYFGSHFKSYNKGIPAIHYIPSPEGIIEFARRSLAYALVPDVSIRNDLKEKTLIDLLPDKPFKLSLYWQTQELQTELTDKFSQSIVSYARSILKE